MFLKLLQSLSNAKLTTLIFFLLSSILHHQPKENFVEIFLSQTDIVVSQIHDSKKKQIN